MFSERAYTPANTPACSELDFVAQSIRQPTEEFNAKMTAKTLAFGDESLKELESSESCKSNSDAKDSCFRESSGGCSGHPPRVRFKDSRTAAHQMEKLQGPIARASVVEMESIWEKLSLINRYSDQFRAEFK